MAGASSAAGRRAARVGNPPATALLARFLPTHSTLDASDYAYAGTALFLWVHALIVPLTLLLDWNGGGTAGWVRPAAVAGAQVALAAWCVLGGLRWRGRCSFWIVALALTAGALAGALPLVRDSRHLLLVFATLWYLLMVLVGRSLDRRGIAVVLTATVAAVWGIAAWSHHALAPPQALDWLSMAIVTPPTVACAGAAYRIARAERERDLEQARAAEEARIDPVTGLLNRAAFLAAAQEAESSVSRDERTLSLLLFDLDGLKDINDSLGHPVGDAALSAVGGALHERRADGDIVARLGGDEFAVLSVHDRALPTDAVADRYAPVLCGILHRDAGSGRTLWLSASWGIATLSPEVPTINALFVRADERLLHHKTAPRLVAFPPDAERPFVPRGRRVLAETLGSLIDMAREVARADDEAELMRSAAERAADLLDTESATIAVHDRGDEHPAWRGYRARREVGGWGHYIAQNPPGPSIIHHVYTSGLPYYTDDVAADPHSNPEAAARLGIRGALCVPLYGSSGQVRGTFFFSNKRGRAPFNDFDVQVARAFGELAMSALEKIEALQAARGESRPLRVVPPTAVRDAKGQSRRLG